MKIYTVTVRQRGESTPYAIAAESEDAATTAVCEMLGVSPSAVVSVAPQKNEAAQELARMSREKPPSPARKAAAVANGKKGGRPVNLLPCPLCGKPARTHTDCPQPVTYCSACCQPERRFYRATAAASARAWNTYARSLS